jgi:hypothetical protein
MTPTPNNSAAPSVESVPGKQAQKRALALANGSAVWVVVQRDMIDGDQCTMHPAYTTQHACLKRMKRLQDREEDSYSYGYRRIPVVGLPITESHPAATLSFP